MGTSTADMWSAFRDNLGKLQVGAGDGTVPIAVLLTPAENDGDGVNVFLDEVDLRVVWNNSIPMNRRIALMKRLASQYSKGQILDGGNI